VSPPWTRFRRIAVERLTIGEGEFAAFGAGGGGANRQGEDAL
jgi:hypothetical protein